jgi:hypothetical protein
MKKKVLILSIIWMALLLNGCFPGESTYSSSEPAGFFSGVWHGWIAPVSLIVGIFKSDVRIYEPINTGWWYDLGFYIAVIAGFGSIALTRKKKKANNS